MKGRALKKVVSAGRRQLCKLQRIGHPAHPHFGAQAQASEPPGVQRGVVVLTVIVKRLVRLACYRL